MARDVAHLAQGMDLLERGFSGKYRAAIAGKPTGKSIKVGRLYLDGTDREIDRALDDALMRSGFQVVPLGEAFKKRWEQADRDAAVVAVADAWLNDRQYTNKVGVSGKAKVAILLGQLAYSNEYRAALSRKTAWKRTLRSMLGTVDFIALPTLKKIPPTLPLIGRSALFEAQVLAMQNTAAVNFAGNPAIAIPVPLEGRAVPLTSLQLIGPRLGEADLVNAARIVEAAHADPVVTRAAQTTEVGT